MRWINFRIAAGAVLILGGILLLLQHMGIWTNAVDFFWAGILAIGAAILLYWFFTDRSRWWAAVPGFALVGMSVSALTPERIGLSGLAFLGFTGVGFFAWYISNRGQRWWAIIPGGVLITLGIISAMSDALKIADTGGMLMIGLGITFLLVGILAGAHWAYIPAAVLVLIGFFIGVPFTGAWQLVWIGVLLAGGVLMILAAFLPRRS